MSVEPRERSVTSPSDVVPENGEPISTTESPSACARTPRSPGTSVSQRPAPSDAEKLELLRELIEPPLKKLAVEPPLGSTASTKWLGGVFAH